MLIEQGNNAASQVAAAVTSAEYSITERMLLLVFQIALIIFAVRIGGGIMKRLKMPSVLGELLAGIIIGPYLLGGMHLPQLGFPHGIFPKGLGSLSVSPELYGVATIASLILLFVSGLETDLRQFLRYSVAGTVVGLGGVIVSFAIGNFTGMIWGGPEITSFMTPTNLFLGILCTATSVGITARILSEKNKMDSPEGVTILAAAVIDDVLGIICLAVVIGLVDVLGAENAGMPWNSIGWIAFKALSVWIGFTALGIIFARPLGRFLKSFRNPTLYATIALGMAFLLSGVFEQAGLAMIIGAYVMGLSLSKTDINFAVQEKLHGLYDFFVPIFFAVMGMLVDVNRILSPQVIKLGLIYGVLAVVAKVVGCAIPALFLNFNKTGALRIGVGMVPRGEVALIIAGIGMSTGILSPDIFGAAIIMTLLTTLLVPPLLSVVLNLPGKGVRHDIIHDDSVKTVFSFPTQAISDAATDKVLSVFSDEGFYSARMDSGSNLYQFRKDEMSFSMHREGEDLIFSSGKRDVLLIRTIVYEALVELHLSLERLKDLIRPEELRKSITASSNVFVSPLRKKSDILQADCVSLNLKSVNKAEVLEEMVDLLYNNKRISDRAEVMKIILEREKTISTGLENGIALPHARTDATASVVAAVGISRQGIDFASLDGELSRLFIMVVSPKNTSGPHLHFLTNISARLKNRESVEKILAAATAEEIINLLIGGEQKGKIR